ncbi:MAG: hypothetical protein AAFV19_07530 [Pseudomonadota bacterium]
MTKVANPFCICDPATCIPPCTCGLRLVARDESARRDMDTRAKPAESTDRHTWDGPA